MKLTVKQKRLLLEALRRYHSFHAGDDPLQVWTGLGTPGEYKPVVESGLMEPVHGEVKRCNGWYRLTPRGLAEVMRLSNLGYKVVDHFVLEPT